MALSLPTALITIASSFILLVSLYRLLFSSWTTKSKDKLSKIPPQAAGAWPIVGHLHLLSGPLLPHVTLGNLADKYGPIFQLKLGIRPVVVISDWSVAKECFTTNDRALAGRPKAIASEIMGYNYAMLGLSPYGGYWREIRKIATLQLLSSHALEMLGHIRVSEVRASLKAIYERWEEKGTDSGPVKMEMKQWFGDLVTNIVVRMIAGKRFSGKEGGMGKCHEAIRKFFEYLGAFVISDFVPLLRWLDLGGYEKGMRETAKEMDVIAYGWLEEHERKRKDKGESEDFIDVMLSVSEGKTETDFSGHHPHTVVKATSLAMLSAGTDTTSVTLTWALCLLLNNKNVLRKAQEELDNLVGKERNVQESDLKNLVYLQAIAKETLRLYPAGPLSVPHESIEDCTIAGCHIPRGTRILTNIWKIHRDPEVWESPDEFRPERFLTTPHKDMDVKGQSFQLIPFGSGRRMCPGLSLGLVVVQFVLASLLHGFDISRPSEEGIDMTESFGLTNMKASPLDVILAPRLPAHLYN